MIGNVNLFGMVDEIGSVEVGKYVDLIVVLENLLNDVLVFEYVDFVMKYGDIYKNEFVD